MVRSATTDSSWQREFPNLVVSLHTSTIISPVLRTLHSDLYSYTEMNMSCARETLQPSPSLLPKLRRLHYFLLRPASSLRTVAGQSVRLKGDNVHHSAALCTRRRLSLIFSEPDRSKPKCSALFLLIPHAPVFFLLDSPLLGTSHVYGHSRPVISITRIPTPLPSSSCNFDSS